MSDKIIHVTDSTFDEAVLKAEGPVLVDCLGTWLTALIDTAGLWEAPVDGVEALVSARTTELCAALAECPHDVVLVTNEVGLGIVPENALARRFRDEAGRLHQALAARAGHVVFMVAGLPMRVK